MSLPKSITILFPRLWFPHVRDFIHMFRHNPDGTQVRIIGVDAQPFNRDLVDQFYSDPDAIGEIVNKEKVDLIVPLHEGEATLFLKQGLPVLSPPLGPLERAADKGELLCLFEELGYPTPDYRLITSLGELEEAALSLGYPGRDLVLKPANRWGAAGLCVITEKVSQDFLSKRQFGAHLPLSLAKKLPEPIPKLLLTEFLPGEEYSVDAFIGKEAKVAIARRRIWRLGGIAMDTEIEEMPQLSEQTLQGGKALGLSSLFGMQYKCDAKGIPKVLECNPRIHGTMIASYFGGVNIPWMAVREALGFPAPQPESPKPIRFTRYFAHRVMS